MSILAAASFALYYTKNIHKGKITGQLASGRGMIILIKHIIDWKLLSHKNNAQINYDNNRENY